VDKHLLYVDKIISLFYLLIQLVLAAKYGWLCRWFQWWLQSDLKYRGSG